MCQFAIVSDYLDIHHLFSLSLILEATRQGHVAVANKTGIKEKASFLLSVSSNKSCDFKLRVGN